MKNVTCFTVALLFLLTACRREADNETTGTLKRYVHHHVANTVDAIDPLAVDLSYDSLGRVVETRSQAADLPPSPTSLPSEAFTYDSAGRCTQLIRIHNGQPGSSEVYLYQDDRHIRTDVYAYDPADPAAPPTLIRYYLYQYNTAGQVVLREYFTDVLKGHTDYVYDADGNIAEVTTKNAAGSVENTTAYTYTDLANPLHYVPGPFYPTPVLPASSTSIYPGSITGPSDYDFQYETDAAGRVTKQTIKESGINGAVLSKTTFEYQ